MVYPVSNPLIQQQIPAATTFAPGGFEAKKPEENKNLDATRLSGTSTARSEASSNRNLSTYASDDRSQDSGGVYGSSSRGTQLDIAA